MDFSYILKTGELKKDSLLKYGFAKEEDKFVLRKPLQDSDFYAEMVLKENEFSAEVYENDTEEKYTLFNVKSARGKFISEIRNQVKEIVEDVKANCFTSTDIRGKYIQAVEKKFGCKGENPFSDDKLQSVVFRTPSKSWFAIIMKIKFKNLGLSGDEEINVVNLKQDPEKIPELVNKDTVFNAWHMNKKHWISVILSGRMDFEKLMELTQRSFELVLGAKK